MNTPLEPVLRRCTAMLLAGAGLLLLWTVPDGGTADAAYAGIIGFVLVIAGGLLVVHPSKLPAAVGAGAGSFVVAVWIAGVVGLRGHRDPITFEFAMAALASGLAVVSAIALLGSSRARVTITTRLGHVGIASTAAAIGIMLGLVVTPSPGPSVVIVASGASATGSTASASTAPADPHASHDSPAAQVGTTPTFVQHNPDVGPEHGPDEPVDAATRALLAQQLEIARETVLRYPTVADAEAAGMMRSGAFSPGAGAHFVFRNGGGGVDANGNVDPANPGAFLYDGISPTSHVVGLMYTSKAINHSLASYSAHDPEPQGFVGPNDHWHRHEDSCMQETPNVHEILFPPDAGVTKEQCEGAGGQFIEETYWMLHVWVVPGWESPTGVFSHTNPDVICLNGSVSDFRGYCEGS